MSELTVEMILTDNIEKYGKGSVIQHGKLNERVYLIKLKQEDFPEILNYIDQLVINNNYSKIFCKVPSWATPEFIAQGFHIEAYIPGFYKNSMDVFFVSKFLNSDRKMNIEKDKLSHLSEIIDSYSNNYSEPQTLANDKLIKLNEEHADEVAHLYKQVFDSYPFPIFDPKYILETMESNVQYYGIERDGKLIALASAEIDFDGENAEMTDFATLPNFRGQNLAVILLAEMEKEMAKQGINSLYTIARLNSLPMNKTFFKLNYKYAGTLIKNTNISGQIESMNVLYKHL